MPFALRPLLAALCLPFGPAAAQSADGQLLIHPPEAVLHYSVSQRDLAIFPRDIIALEISDSGGITDIFLRLGGEASKTLSMMTENAVGMPMIVRVCGRVMLAAVVQVPVRSGTVYIPDTTAIRAEALRALWQGRSRCDTMDAEVFIDGE